jgi:hypothetical protein
MEREWRPLPERKDPQNMVKVSVRENYPADRRVAWRVGGGLEVATAFDLLRQIWGGVDEQPAPLGITEGYTRLGAAWNPSCPGGLAIRTRAIPLGHSTPCSRAQETNTNRPPTPWRFRDRSNRVDVGGAFAAEANGSDLGFRPRFFLGFSWLHNGGQLISFSTASSCKSSLPGGIILCRPAP